MNFSKTFKNSAILLGIACFITVMMFSAFRMYGPQADEKLATTTWVYIGPDLPNVANFSSSNYVQNPGSLPATCNLETDLPCQFIVPDTVNTLTKLENYLTDMYGDEPADLRDHANTQKGYE